MANAAEGIPSSVRPERTRPDDACIAACQRIHLRKSADWLGSNRVALSPDDLTLGGSIVSRHHGPVQQARRKDIAHVSDVLYSQDATRRPPYASPGWRPVHTLIGSVDRLNLPSISSPRSPQPSGGSCSCLGPGNGQFYSDKT